MIVQFVRSFRFCESVQPLRKASYICYNKFLYWSRWLNWNIKVKAVTAISMSCFIAIKWFNVSYLLIVHAWEAIILKILPSALPSFWKRFAFEHRIFVNFRPSRVRLNAAIFRNDYSHFFYTFPILFYQFINFILLVQ
jgi:hypothetical protein